MYREWSFCFFLVLTMASALCAGGNGLRIASCSPPEAADQDFDDGEIYRWREILREFGRLVGSLERLYSNPESANVVKHKGAYYVVVMKVSATTREIGTLRVFSALSGLVNRGAKNVGALNVGNFKYADFLDTVDKYELIERLYSDGDDWVYKVDAGEGFDKAIKKAEDAAQALAIEAIIKEECNGDSGSYWQKVSFDSERFIMFVNKRVHGEAIVYTSIEVSLRSVDENSVKLVKRDDAPCYFITFTTSDGESRQLMIIADLDPEQALQTARAFRRLVELAGGEGGSTNRNFGARRTA